MTMTIDDMPTYYKGSNGYIAKDVVKNFNLSYNVGTAVTYLLRSKNKHDDGGIEDIKKAINHLNFELEELYDRDFFNKIKNNDNV